MVLSKQEGMCLILNTVIFRVLCALGCDISLTVGSVISENGHTFCIAKALDKIRKVYLLSCWICVSFFHINKLVRGGDSEISSTASLALKYRHMEIGECCAYTGIGVVSFAEDSKIGSISRMY